MGLPVLIFNLVEVTKIIDVYAKTNISQTILFQLLVIDKFEKKKKQIGNIIPKMYKVFAR